MALNKQMHPRNPFKNNKPNFKELASKHEEFRKQVTVDLKGRVHLDFKKPECLRALSWVLLNDLYGLEVDMPLDRLIPTIPLRLNYILWLEDLVSLSPSAAIRGLDIGTGASCVYPLIGAKKNGWRFTATEADRMNWEVARRNVVKNGLEGQIKVLKVSPDSSLLEAVVHPSPSSPSPSSPAHSPTPSVQYDFCMCNPPFFGSNFEAWGLTKSRGEARPEPKSVSTASPAESIYPGGEVEFVRHMINDSHQLKEKVRIYTTMLGKKSSLTILKEDLRRTEVPRVGTTEFCQGRTMRWGLAWSFDLQVTFTKSGANHPRPLPPLVYSLLKQQTESMGLEYSVEGVCDRLIKLLTHLKFELTEEVNLNTKKSWQIRATDNTWSHQRRKRRQKHRQAEKGEAGTDKRIRLDDGESVSTGKEGDSGEGVVVMETGEPGDGRSRSCDVGESGETEEGSHQGVNDEKVEPDATAGISKGGKEVKSQQWDGSAEKRTDSECVKCEDTLVNMTGVRGIERVQSEGAAETAGEQNQEAAFTQNVYDNRAVETGSSLAEEGGACGGVSDGPVNHTERCLLTSRLTLCMEAESVAVEMEWIDGQSRELMHQVMQYLRNKLLTKLD